MKQLAQVEIVKMRQLANFLETIPPSQFDISEWEYQKPKPARTMFFGLFVLEKECGFAGCAMGWAAHSQLFPGLYMDRSDEWGDVVYNGATGFDAAVRLFKINQRTAGFLFSAGLYSDWDVSPADVADRLNRFADKVESRLARKQNQKPKLRLITGELLHAA